MWIFITDDAWMPKILSVTYSRTYKDCFLDPNLRIVSLFMHCSSNVFLIDWFLRYRIFLLSFHYLRWHFNVYYFLLIRCLLKVIHPFNNSFIALLIEQSKMAHIFSKLAEFWGKYGISIEDNLLSFNTLSFIHV